MTGIWFSLVAAILWGLSYALDERVMKGFSAKQTLLMHYAVGFFLSLLWVPTSGIFIGLRQMTSKDAVTLSASLLATYTAALLILTSISKVGATTAAVIEVSYPFWTALSAYLLFKEAMTLHQALGGTLIVLGVWIASKSA